MDDRMQPVRWIADPVDMAAIRKLMLLGRREQSAFMLFWQAAEPAVVREIGRDRHESKIPRTHTNVNELQFVAPPKCRSPTRSEEHRLGKGRVSTGRVGG